MRLRQRKRIKELEHKLHVTREYHQEARDLYAGLSTRADYMRTKLISSRAELELSRVERVKLIAALVEIDLQVANVLEAHHAGHEQRLRYELAELEALRAKLYTGGTPPENDVVHRVLTQHEAVRRMAGRRHPPATEQ